VPPVLVIFPNDEGAMALTCKSIISNKSNVAVELTTRLIVIWEEVVTDPEEEKPAPTAFTVPVPGINSKFAGGAKMNVPVVEKPETDVSTTVIGDKVRVSPIQISVKGEEGETTVWAKPAKIGRIIPPKTKKIKLFRKK
jgi:hypothetical protein